MRRAIEHREPEIAGVQKLVRKALRYYGTLYEVCRRLYGDVEHDPWHFLVSFKSTLRPVSYNAHTATHTEVSTPDCPYRHTARTGDMMVTHTIYTAVRVRSRYG